MQDKRKFAFIGHGTEMQDRVREYPWHETPLGALEDWPVSLRTIVSAVLNSTQPMFLFWGPELIQIYNDGYRPSFGVGKHPMALGQRGLDCWGEIWETIGPLLENVMQGGSTALYEDQMLSVWRNGRMEDGYWTYTYTPVYDEADSVAGVLTVVTETTVRVVSERRQGTLAWLMIQFRGCQSASEVLERLKMAATMNPADLPAIAFEPFSANHILERGYDEPWETLTLAARSLGIDTDLVVHFRLGSRVPLDEPYSEFLRNVTVSAAAALLDIHTIRTKELTVAERNQLLMDAPVAAAVLIGDDLVYQLANPAYHEMTARDEIEGLTFDEVFPELVGTPARRVLQQALEIGQPHTQTEMPVQIYRNTVFEERYYNFNLTPLQHPSGGIYGVMVMAIDITAQVAARKQMEVLNNDLQAAVRSKDEFLAMLGHELRNPLAPIVTALQLIQLKGHTLTDEHLLIQRQVSHLVRLVDDLLDISRITKGIVELRKQRADLRELISRAVEMCDDLLERNQHRLRIDVPAIDIVCDPARIAQVLANLLTNAARYTQPGGDIRLTAHDESGKLRVSVEDNGIGISANLMPKIFDLFVQGKRKADRSEGGLGLGLSLVKNLVGLHGGQVFADSAGDGFGSTFSILLPMNGVPDDESEAHVTDAVDFKKPGGGNILLVDDNIEAVDALTELMQHMGFSVSTAYHPAQAIDLFSRQFFDVAVLDIGLPEMDGYELLTRLKSLDSNPDCRFIALSGYGQPKDKTMSRETGFSHHLVKPIASSELLSVLRSKHAPTRPAS